MNFHREVNFLITGRDENIDRERRDIFCFDNKVEVIFKYLDEKTFYGCPGREEIFFVLITR